MKRFVFLAIIIVFFYVNLTNAGEGPDDPSSMPANSSENIRTEFEGLFGHIKIYQAIRKYLPERYEELYRSYVEAKQDENMSKFKASAFINSIRNAYLKKSSDPTILEFYRHIIETGRKIYSQNPDAAFSYIFGGNPNDYSDYIDLDGEMETLGRIFEHLLSTSRQENMEDINREEADNGMTLVFLDLHYRYGEKLGILESKDYGSLSNEERSSLCDIYLYMHEQIFNLEPPTRNNVLRSFALNL